MLAERVGTWGMAQRIAQSPASSAGTRSARGITLEIDGSKKLMFGTKWQIGADTV